ncbi:MAG: hypothetical protein E3J21_26945 [Anaerolineales bacterium]|nr:MAG: hypothetical protein E3J21_26945 [Anaerolineales bacterium]
MTLRFTIPLKFTESHRQVVYRYLSTPESLPPHIWATLFEAMDLLRTAMVSRHPGQQRTFASLYHSLLDLRYADAYIATLLDSENPSQISMPLWAAVARRITQELRTSEFFEPNVPGSRLLVGYLLYWWQQFARGYAFEIEILQDLTASHLDFKSHNLRVRTKRLSPVDLVVASFRGDVKTSTYFLAQQRHPDPDIDFYITRAWLPTSRVRTLVVFLRPAMWQKIDGETSQTTLDTLEQVLPQPGSVQIGTQTVIVVDYEIWKEKMRIYQREVQDDSDA